jgi:hypothetical protein
MTLFEKNMDMGSFDAWFAGSKLVRKGRPQLFYHSSDDTDFTKFIPSSPYPQGVPAVYFATSKEHADAFRSGRVISAYLKALRPFSGTDADVAAIRPFIQKNAELLMDDLRENDSATLEELEGLEGEELVEGMLRQVESQNWQIFEHTRLGYHIKSLGYDAMLLFEDAPTVAVFNPGQIWVVNWKV